MRQVHFSFPSAYGGSRFFANAVVDRDLGWPRCVRVLAARSGASVSLFGVQRIGAFANLLADAKSPKYEIKNIICVNGTNNLPQP